MMRLVIVCLCKICGNPNAHFSVLFEEPMCDECTEWALKHGIVSRTSIDEQYRFYMESYPLNDPRD